MRLSRIIVLGMLVGFWFPAAGKAGVYSTGEKLLEPSAQPAAGKAPSFDRFRLSLDEIMEIPDTARNTQRRQDALKRRDELQAKVDADPDNVTDRINLSAYLIRLGEYDKAIPMLEGLARGVGRNNFMVAGNLATAYQQLGDPQSLQRADDYLQQAIAVWPAEFPGLTKEQLAWYKEAEKTQLKLVRARRKELSAQGGKAKPPEAVDDLCGVQFVGDDGTYQAGKIAAAQKEKLPKDAVPLVEQLILWMPNDGRLYWLLGELLNADGDMASAKLVLDQCADGRRINAAELRQHRQVLAEAMAPKSWLPDRDKLIMVGGGVGIVVLFLAYFQVREIRRRRKAPE
jgi:tetratricopeptide (TPR) repeat protein